MPTVVRRAHRKFRQHPKAVTASPLQSALWAFIVETGGEKAAELEPLRYVTR